MKDKDSFEFCGHSDEILLLFFKSTHCLEKWELKISFFFFFIWKSLINLFSWEISGITGIFLLFKKVFNMDQYVLGLVLGSNIFLLSLNSIYFLKWRLMNLVDSERTQTLQKINYFCYFSDNICTQHFFHWLNFDLAFYPRLISVIKFNCFWKYTFNCCINK